ncbi:type II secretion system protein GspM [Hyphobacterium marinum]|uniref:Type II secretion system protein GspM n=1 Tax=Hyphobacterium marinum TaxID=3116574 RepID=A0ABU7LW34_9PROT|nr:type II secretion system protein GspM [Hyphobacterium sp. Y6023]MEE2565767.1 type II secretion system protein GspM [Hyphobacterium sp. Y6023]
MSARRIDMTSWWQGRTGREQGLLAGLALVLGVLVLWYGIIAPVVGWRDTSRARYEVSAERYLHVTAELARIEGSAEAHAVQTYDRPLRTVAGERAAAHGLAISRVLPDGDGQLNLWIEAAPAGSLTDWLSDLDRNHAVRVERLTLDRRADRLVNAQIVLRREVR